jgi:hypothetical protein
MLSLTAMAKSYSSYSTLDFRVLSSSEFCIGSAIGKSVDFDSSTYFGG